MMQPEEVMECKVFPPHLNNTYVRPPSPEVPELIRFKIPPTNRLSEYNSTYNQIHFTINSTNLLDPYAFYLELIVENDNGNPIQLDGSAHSLISSIAVYSRGVEIEKIKDYDFIQNLVFDMQLTPHQRKVRKFYEGFGDNRYGTNETIIWGKSDYIDLYKTSKVDLQNYSRSGSNINIDEYFPLKSNPSYNEFKPLIETNDISNYKSSSIARHDKPILPHLNKWDYVINGKLSPSPIPLKDVNESKKTFRIPLMLKTIGFGQQLNNYKLVPLELFPQLTIIITLNPDAFFVPTSMTEYMYFKNDTFYKNNKNEREQNTNLYNNNGEVSNSYKVTSASLLTEQYKFSPAIHASMMNVVRSGGYVLDFIDLEIIAREYTKMAPTITYSRSLSRNNIKAIYITFSNDLYKHSKYARKLARFNKGLKKITFRQAGAQYPPNTLIEHNSLNSHGKENAQWFYEELTKALGRNSCDDDTVINLTSFCLDYDISHIWGIMHYLHSRKAGGGNNALSIKNISENIQIEYDQPLTSFTDKSWTDKYLLDNKNRYIFNTILDSSFRYLEKDYSTDFSKTIDNPCSKCIYALNFETIPHSGGLYRGGLNTK
jgi:hypothetical protein